ncbi:MAG TPA: type II secretion system F family protein [Blastocatellia bacterium]|nr:type II secretion system F family protein [Blastocatellia bacterium]
MMERDELNAGGQRGTLRGADYPLLRERQAGADEDDLRPAGATGGQEMIGYKYKGRTNLGNAVTGCVDEVDEDVALSRLARAQITVDGPLVPRYARFNRRAKKVTRTDIALFADQLADRLKSGESMVLALTRCAKATSHPKLRAALDEVIVGIEDNGLSTADAILQYPDVFPPAFARIIQIGEQKGDPTALLVDYSEGELRTAETWRRLRGMLSYPITVLVVAFIIGAGLVYYVLPKMEELYKALLAASGGELPWPTEVMLGGSRFLASVPGVMCVLAVIVGIVAAIRWARGAGKETIERKSLDWPVVGPLLRDVNAAYVARTIGLLWDVTDATTTFRETASATGNIRYREMIDHVRDTIPLQGTKISDAFFPYPHLMGADFLPALLAGEASGTIDSQLTRYSRLLEKRVQQQIEALMRKVEPITIAILGLVIGLIVIASYLPLFTLIGKLSNH